MKRQLLFVGVICSVLPDFDALYFYLIDSSQHHHGFFTHLPLFWIAMAIAGLGISAAMQSRFMTLALLVGTANVLLHLALDSIAGRIQWLAPFADHSLTLVEIPARYDS